MLCASCGTAGSDDIKLRKCACHLVKYCSVKCQKDHRPKHKKECKKRVAELHDEILFKQPESTHYGDCPICCLPLLIDKSKFILMSCCCKQICRGCYHANMEREYVGKLEHKCPFCRKAVPDTEEGHIKQMMNRMEANDPVAICYVANRRYENRDYNAAFEYWKKAAALGDANAHHQLSVCYKDGRGVEKDQKRAIHHAEKAAIGGHPGARHNLGCVEVKNAQHSRAVKHFTIAAKLGDDVSLERLKVLYKRGYASKDDFLRALRGYQDAIEEAKSPQREEAAKFAEGTS